MELSRENIRIQRWVLVVGVLLFGIKVGAWYLTNSVAILTDALESTVNVFSAALGLYSLWLTSLPRDANHPYGHGKVEFLSAAMEGTLIGVAGILIIWESVNRLFVPQPVEQMPLGILLIAMAGIINALVGLLAKRAGIRNHSIALESSGRHLLSDAWSTAGLLIGLILVVITGYGWLDAAVAMVFGGIILFTGYRILRRSIAGIMDEADEALLEELVTFIGANRRENWVDMHNLRIIKYGRILHIDCHLTVPWFLQVAQAHQEVDALESTVREKFGDRVELFVHTDGCRPSACSICAKDSCVERKATFQGAITWTLANSISTARHIGKA